MAKQDYSNNNSVETLSKQKLCGQFSKWLKWKIFDRQYNSGIIENDGNIYRNLHNLVSNKNAITSSNTSYNFYFK